MSFLIRTTLLIFMVCVISIPVYAETNSREKIISDFRDTATSGGTGDVFDPDTGGSFTDDTGPVTGPPSVDLGISITSNFDAGGYAIGQFFPVAVSVQNLSEPSDLVNPDLITMDHVYIDITYNNSSVQLNSVVQNFRSLLCTDLPTLNSLAGKRCDVGRLDSLETSNLSFNFSGLQATQTIISVAVSGSRDIVDQSGNITGESPNTDHIDLNDKSDTPVITIVSPPPADPAPVAMDPEPTTPSDPEPVATDPEPTTPSDPEPVATDPEPVAMDPEPTTPSDPEPVATDPEPTTPSDPEPMVDEPTLDTSTPPVVPVAVNSDLTGDRKADVLVRNQFTGVWRLFPLAGRSLIQNDSFGRVFISEDLQWTTLDVADFTGDGQSDILQRHVQSAAWQLIVLNGRQLATQITVNLPDDLLWELAATGDFNNDDQTDVVLRHANTGQWRLYTIVNGQVTNPAGNVIALTPDLNWIAQGAEDFNADGTSDLVLRNQVSGLWLMVPMQGSTVLRGPGTDFGGIPITQDLNWEVASMKDMTGDRRGDLLLRHRITGRWLMLPMQGKQVDRGSDFGGVRFLATTDDWQPVMAEDFTGDGRADMLIRNTVTGAWRLHPMAGRTVVRNNDFGGLPVIQDTSWELQ